LIGKIYIERGGGGTAKDTTYDNDTYDNVQDALDALLVPALAISSFTNNTSTKEYGETVSSVILTWVVNKTLTSQSIDNSIGNLTSTLRTYTHSEQAITAPRTYTLSAVAGSESTTATTSISFSHKRYWGNYAGTTIDNAGILSLSKEFASSRLTTKTIAGDGNYLYICYPAVWGEATFKVNGLQNTAWVFSTQNFTNASGNTSLFNIYRSIYLQYGTGIEVQVL
jgi:hypothetical protein